MSAPNWATLETELPILIGELLETSCRWSDQPGQMRVGAHATLDVLAPSSLGTDDVRWAELAPEVPEDPPTVQATVLGQRELTLQVSVWSASQRFGSSARLYLERLRTRLRMPATLDRLRALGLGLVRIEAMVDVDPVQDGRVVSMTAMDVRLAYVASEVDAAIPYIETARVESEYVRDAAGNALPAEIQHDTLVES